jgi:preprotein translocase subunit SecF
MALSRRDRREQRRKLLKDQRLQQLRTLEEQEKKAERKSEYRGFLKIYDKHYLKLLIIPIVIFVFCLGAIVYQVATTGDFMNKGVSLKGGMVVTVPVHESVSIAELEDILKAQFPKDDLEVRSISELGVQRAVIITTDNLEAEKNLLEAITPLIPAAKDEASSETTGSSLGGGFFNQTMMAMLIAFVCMSIVVFISFRSFAPSIMVIVCVLTDIIETLAVVNLLGMKISTAGIAAFLMLIGYSVDTDVLLTSRVMRGKEGTVFDRIVSAAKTGLLMTFTAITAVGIGLVMSQSGTIKEIMTIILIGLAFDIINTWIQNVALLRYYVEHKMGRKKTAKPAPEEEEELLEEESEADGGEAQSDSQQDVNASKSASVEKTA